MRRTQKMRSAGLAAALLSTLALAACGGSATGGKAGAPVEPVTLTLGNAGTADEGVHAFIRNVETLSKGALKIKLVTASIEGADYEQRIIRDTAAGRFDLAWVGGRALDEAGVTDAGALQVPFLIDSYDLEGKVVNGPIGADIMRATEKATGVVGLGLLPDQLRYLVTVAPISAPDDLRGRKLRALASPSQESAWRALGAIPVTMTADTKVARVRMEKGQLFGIETDASTWSHGTHAGAVMTVGAPVWPRTVALLAAPERFHRLPGATQALLKRAAAQAADGTLRALAASDDDAVAQLCRTGALVAALSDEQRESFRQTGVAMAEQVRQSATYGPVVERIVKLKGAAAAQSPPTIPSTCASKPAAQEPTGRERQDIARSLAAALKPGSVWRAKADYKTMVPVVGEEQARSNSGTQTFRFLRGNRFVMTMDPAFPDVGGGAFRVPGRFEIEGDRLKATMENPDEAEGHTTVECEKPTKDRVSCVSVASDELWVAPLSIAGTTGPLIRVR